MEMIDRCLADALRQFQAIDVRVIATDLDWYAFPQDWGSTALGFGGIGGQMCTRAQTVVVCDEYLTGKACVYFGGRFAYIVHQPYDKLWKAMTSFYMPPVDERGKVEGE